MVTSFGDHPVFGTRTGDGPVEVVALHGWARTHKDFAEVLHGRDALALDLPGTGSPQPPTAWSTHDYDLVDAVLDTLDDPVVLLATPSVDASPSAGVADRRRPRAGAHRRPIRRRTRPAGRSSATAPSTAHRFGLVGDDRMEQARGSGGSADYAAGRRCGRSWSVSSRPTTPSPA